MSDAVQRDALKRLAAEQAVTLIQSGMVVGLGVGSTAIFAIRRIAELLASGELRDIVGVPCALRVEEEAQRLGIPLTTLEEHSQVDLTIDGADEVDPQLNLIKGGGAALLREKIVAQSSRREVIVVDEAKLSPVLGTQWAIPVEVVRFGWGAQARWIASLGAEVALRRQPDGEPLTTDQGNYILDCNFGPIADLTTLATQLSLRTGIVDHGLFLGLATDLIVAGADGIRHIQRPAS
ncbi:ribose 5-phosphate isomerase [Oscillochloris trichoides DG-6]|uniref:Ribose-5-phosphate isomerase A n=1 Tax=Oscillochloris trichoides DG-6 TaxID=765420 RepID=E1ID11_9CHLR|nr:ribose-5-phosphate isomerase RpiA [Oscillochloris trichoides]EFO80920.1 ribose 5-phosphate isomerase [Oscillochloris trichoides DG-6]